MATAEQTAIENLSPLKRALLDAGMEQVFTVARGKRGIAKKASVTVDTMLVPDTILARSVVHGLRQKIGDRVAPFKNRPISEMGEAMEDVRDALYGGAWNVRGTQVLTLCRGLILSAVENDPEAAESAGMAEVPRIRTMGDLEVVCDMLKIDASLVYAKAERLLDERESTIDEFARKE